MDTDLKSKRVSDSDDEDLWYTIDDAISAVGVGPFQHKLLFLTGFIWSADAMEMMLLSFLIPKLKDDWDLAQPEDGLIGFVVFAGNFFGTMLFSILSDRIGRRKVVIVCNLLCAIFGTLAGLSPNVYLLLFFRFGVGFSIGGAAVSYVLFAEYAPKELRGSLLIIEQGFWALGALFSVFLAWVSLTYLNWRWYLIFSAIPLWIISAFYKWVPESSRYLLASGQYYQAQSMLRRLAKENNGILPPGRLKPIHTNHMFENRLNASSNSPSPNANSKSASVDDLSEFEPREMSVQRGHIKDIFVPAYRRTSILLLIAFFLCVFGYYGISFISERYFETSKDSSETSEEYWEMAITTSSEIPGLIIGGIFLDKIGRRKSMYYCFGIYSICCFLLMFEFIQSSNIFGILFVFIARMTVSLGFLVIYVYYSEYYPTVIRTTALGFASSLGRIAGMITSFVSEDMSLTTGMCLYAIGGAISCICMFFLEQDTTGIELATEINKTEKIHTTKSGHIELQEEMDADLGGNDSITSPEARLESIDIEEEDKKSDKHSNENEIEEKSDNIVNSDDDDEQMRVIMSDDGSSPELGVVMGGTDDTDERQQKPFI